MEIGLHLTFLFHSVYKNNLPLLLGSAPHSCPEQIGNKKQETSRIVFKLHFCNMVEKIMSQQS